MSWQLTHRKITNRPHDRDCAWVIKIYSAANIVDAQLICDALLNAGLQASIEGGYLTGATGELPADTLINVWLYEPMHRKRARAIIQDIEHSRKEPAFELVCPQCEEASTSHFSLCWNCGARLEQ